jgi:hypothetical protein
MALSAMLVGTTYYVATNGNDSNNGLSTATPFLTITHAVSVLKPGDTLYIRAGTYAETIANNIPAGTYNNSILISAYPGEAVIIQAATVNNMWDIGSLSSYVTLQNLVFDGSLMTGQGTAIIKLDYTDINNYAHHITISGCEVRNGPDTGVPSTSAGVNGILITQPSPGGLATYHTITGCKIHDNGGVLNTLNHGIYCTTNNNTITGNDMYNNSGYGIQFFHNGTATTAFCSNNVVSGNKLHGNINRSGMVVSDGDSNTVFNNVIYGNHDTGVNVKTGAANTKVYFNTIYNNAGLVDGGGIHVGSGIIGTIAKDNIMSTNVGGDWLDNGTGTVSDYNETKDATGVGANTLINSDPLFVNAGANDFHLQAGSPAKASGLAISGITVDFAGTVRGSPPSRGAFE